MRKMFYFIFLLLFTFISVSVDGQELRSKQDSNNKYGYIDKYGGWIIEPKYDYAPWGFSDGIAQVQFNGKWGVIDKLGEWIIEPQYDVVGPFSGGLASVKLNDKCGAIDIVNNIIVPIEHKCDYDSALVGAVGNAKNTIIPKKEASGEYDKIRNKIEASQNKVKKHLTSYSHYAQYYVQKSINEWQKKGEFETTIAWKQRVNEQTREQMVADISKQAEEKYFERRTGAVLYFQLGKYDADNQVFLIENSLFGKLLVPVPIDKAQSFKSNWRYYTREPKFFIKNDQICLAELILTNRKTQEQYKYSDNASLNYTVADITYHFDPIELDIATTSTSSKGSQNITTETITIGKSDVDIDIPETNAISRNTFAVIISNENYKMADRVEMSLNDGEIFKEYCHKTLGLPELNIKFYKDATYGELLGAVDNIKNISEAYNGEIDIIFYYSGHGFPNEETRDAYLLPIDGSVSQMEISYPLSRLYSELNSTKAQHITIFLDACFSGSQRDGTMLASARGVVLKPKMAAPTDNMIVFAASSGNETAYPYRAKNHGLFTYYLLKKLKQSKGKVTLEELGDYITKNVKQRSAVENNKPQTPTVSSVSTRYLVPIDN